MRNDVKELLDTLGAFMSPEQRIEAARTIQAYVDTQVALQVRERDEAWSGREEWLRSKGREMNRVNYNNGLTKASKVVLEEDRIATALASYVREEILKSRVEPTPVKGEIPARPDPIPPLTASQAENPVEGPGATQ